MPADVLKFPLPPALPADIPVTAEAVTFTCDSIGRTTSVDSAYTELTGMTLDDCLNHGWLNFIHPEDAPHYMRRQYKAFGDGRTFKGSARFLCRGEVYVKLSVTIAPTFDYKGQLTGWAGVVTYNPAEVSVPVKVAAQ